MTGLPKNRPEALGLPLKYDADLSKLPEHVARRFVRMELGAEGADYVARVSFSRPGPARTALHRALRGFVSDFDASGLLGMYPMHLLGTSQWKTLLSGSPVQRLLDVGAGAGDITAQIAPLATTVVTTESSRVMASRLRRRGFDCREVDIAQAGVPSPGYDLVTCLNVLDRCPRPRTLLRRMVEGLVPGGRLVIATPLPFDAFFYDGPRSLAQEESLRIPNGDAVFGSRTRQAARIHESAGPSGLWEDSVAALVENELLPLGLSVEALSRVPYLCQGDSKRHMYVLDDAVLVCNKSV